MKPKRERIIALSARIQSLRETVADAKQRLGDAEAELDALLEGKEVEVTTAPLVQRVLRLIGDNPVRTWSVEDLQGALGDEDAIPTLRSTLARLAGDGRIERLGRGEYRAVQVAPAVDDGPEPLEEDKKSRAAE